MLDLLDLRAILMRDWDPIGVQDEPRVADEYDDYARAIIGLLQTDASVAVIANYLLMVERERMGLSGDPTRAANVAEKIIASKAGK